MNEAEFKYNRGILETYTLCLLCDNTKDEVFRILETIFDLGYTVGKRSKQNDN